jgi:endonuclease G
MPDNTLPDGWYKVSTGDYTGSGFDRGHLCPSSDRDATPEDNQSTFLMVNIVPQSPAHNQEPWRMLEEYCRKLANDGFEMYIIAGVRGQGGTGKNGSAQTIGQNQPITVPESLWKIIVVLPNGANDIQRIDTSTRIIAVDMPNTEVVSKTNWQQYIVSVDDIERATGYDFLSNVPKNIQRVIEARKDKGQ